MSVSSELTTIEVIYGRVRDHLAFNNYDAMMSFIAQRNHFDSPLNLYIKEMLGDESIEPIIKATNEAKAGDAFWVSNPNNSSPSIIFAVMPIWDTALSNEEKFLSRCYRNSLSIAKNNGIKNILLPALGKGKANFPHQRIVRLSLSAIKSELGGSINKVSILCADKTMYDAYSAKIV